MTKIPKRTYGIKCETLLESDKYLNDFNKDIKNMKRGEKMKEVTRRSR